MYRSRLTIVLLALLLLSACTKKEEAAAPAPASPSAPAPAVAPAVEPVAAPVAAPAPPAPATALPPLAATIPAERREIERREAEHLEELRRAATRAMRQPAPPSGPPIAMTNGGAVAPRAASSPALNADQERLRARDAYLASLAQGSYTFNPPSPIKVARPVSVALWVDPVKSAAELTEEMRRTLPDSTSRVEAGRTTWSPRMKATLSGADFDITPVGDKNFDGIKDLSATGRTEWGWTLVPTAPGTKKLHLVLSVILPPELGLPRELPQLERNVQVEVTVWWLIDHYWERYWQWMLGGLASAAAAAIAWWWQHRRGSSRQG